MKIKSVHLNNFKRFTDLTISDISPKAKLVVLVGPNGCGKSSLFDAFKSWHMLRGFGTGWGGDYSIKVLSKDKNYGVRDTVNIEFYDEIRNKSQDDLKDAFYFRTAYRNSPEVKVSSLTQLASPLNNVDSKKMIQNDSTVNENYQRLMAKTLSNVFDVNYNKTTVEALRDEILGKIREPLKRLFPDLTLMEIGVVTEKAEFYFKKGVVERYGYEKLSGGEKAAFDLLLDIVIKSEYYKNTVFCIDEPETHIHTKLQAALLGELFNLIPDESQLWIATHSFGMLKEAKKLLETHPDEVVFLNFDGYDFDDVVNLKPTSCISTIWDKLVEISLDDYAPYLSPTTIVFCEGNTNGKKRKDFDARCYTNIFQSDNPETMFYSLGSCNDIEEKKIIVEFISKLSKSAKIIRVMDRDDRSDDEIKDAENDGIKVLGKRHIECYLLDDEVLEKWCKSVGKESEISNVLKIKEECLAASFSRGNPKDDVKSAANDICTKVKKLLGVTACGNNGESIMRDTLAPLITKDMETYTQLKKCIFD